MNPTPETLKKWNAMKRRSMIKAMGKPKTKKRRKARISKITGQPIISHQEAKRRLDKAFNAYIRARDPECVMGLMFPNCSGYLTAGHVVPKEDSINVRWIEHNVFGQCSGHNLNHRYRRSNYNTWFMRHYGHDIFAELTELASQPPKKYTTDEMVALTKYYQDLTKSL